MFNFSDAHHFRKTVAGICMVLAPLFLLIGMVIHPGFESEEAAQLAAAAGDRDAWYAAHLFLLMGIVTMVPAALGLMHMLREREVARGHAGGVLAMLGLMAMTGVVAVEGFVAWQAAGGGAEMTALYERLHDSAGYAIPFLVVALMFGAGMLVLAWGVYRARAVQSWTAVGMAAGAVCFTIAGPLASDVPAIVGAALMFVSMGAIGRAVLAESDADWEHTPEVQDFRPLPGLH